MTVTINHTWYTNFGNGSTTGYYAVAKWTAGATVVAGQLIRQNTTPAVQSERVFVCIIAGTSATPTEPTWILTKGAKTVDGTATWMECTGLPAVNGDLTNTPLSSQNRSGVQVLGYIVANNAGTYYFICTTAGTTGASEPTYVTTAGSTTTDNLCTWTCIGTVGSFGAWAAPMARLGLIATWPGNGDVVYVSNAHNETISGSSSILFPGTLASPSSVISVSNTSYNPPLSTDVASGATLSNTSTQTIQGNTTFTGLTFTSTAGGNFSIANSNTAFMRFQNCTTSTNAQINIGSTASSNNVEWYNHTASAVTLAVNSPLVWRGGTGGGYSGVQSQFFSPGNYSSRLFVEGVDLTNCGPMLVSLASNTGQQVFSGCKLAAGVTALNQTPASPRSPTVDVINCDSGNGTFRHERWWNEGSQVVDQNALRTGGASDGTTALAWRIATTTGASWNYPFECMPITVWNSVTGANVTVTLQGAYNGAALPYNDQIWMDVRYYGASSSPLLSTISGTKTNVLASHTQYSASSAAWDSIATTRANSTVYSLGNYFRIGANAGQLFICTTAGTSASSQPGAYTGVADGTLVTDGSAVFRAVIRFSMSVTLTSPQPQIAGYIRCYVRAALASSTFWIDPLITLS